MKKSFVKLILLLICLVLCVSVAAAESSKALEKESLQSQCEVIENIHKLYSNDEFGGLYLEGDTLIINVVGSEEATKNREAIDRIRNNLDVEFRTVRHSLQELENVKDYLTQYMTKYGISALDANEVTNQVDIYLHDYSDNVIEKVKGSVLDKYGEDIYLNFIDMSGTEIRFTVASGE